MIREFVTYLAIFLTIINTYLLYFNQGYLAGMPGNILAFCTFGVLVSILLLFTINNLSIKRGVKKFTLRLCLLLAFGLFLVSLFTRSTELQVGDFLWRWAQTISYGIIVLCLISCSNFLYLKLKKIIDDDLGY